MTRYDRPPPEGVRAERGSFRGEAAVRVWDDAERDGIVTIFTPGVSGYARYVALADEQAKLGTDAE